MKTCFVKSMSKRRRRIRSLGTILSLVTGLCFDTAIGAQFTIGVWQPGGHVAADASFGTADVSDLTALGIDLLVDSTPRVDDLYPADHTQDFEESIMSQWSGSGGFVVYFEPEGSSEPLYWNLERYAGTIDIIGNKLL